MSLVRGVNERFSSKVFEVGGWKFKFSWEIKWLFESDLINGVKVESVREVG